MWKARVIHGYYTAYLGQFTAAKAETGGAVHIPSGVESIMVMVIVHPLPSREPIASTVHYQTEAG